MTAHPVADLIEEDVLRLRVAQQVVEPQRGLGSLDHDFEPLVSLLEAFERHSFIDILDTLRVELVEESLERVAERRLDSLPRATSLSEGT